MSPRTKEQITKLKQEREAQIKSSALDLFCDSGYNATTMSQVAQKAGISKGSIYTYFDSKERLLMSLLNDAFERKKAWYPLHLRPIDSKEKFKEVIRLTFNDLIAAPKYWKLLLALSLQSEVQQLISTLREEQATGVAQFEEDVSYFFTHCIAGGFDEMLFFNLALSGAFNAYVAQDENNMRLTGEQIQDIFIKKIEQYPDKL